MKNITRYCSLIFSVTLLLQACKKDSSTPAAITFEKLGDVPVGGLTGFAANGDPLGGNATGEAIRWNSTARQWERLGGPFTLSNGSRLAVVAEDAAGNFYGNSSYQGNFVLAAGSSTWQPVSLPDTEPALYQTANPPFTNASGTVVLQTRRQTSAGIRERIYRKNPGTSSWTRVNERPTDNLAIVQLADNGDVFLENQGQGAPGVYVLKAGATALVPVMNCAGTVVLPYCGFQVGVSPAGDVVFHQGGTGSRQMYRIAAGATYPATAQELYKLPDGTSNFFDFAALSNGTTLGVANNGGYGTYKLYLRTAAASGWQEAPALPGSGGSTYVYVRTNRQGQAYTASRQSAAGQGSVYRINF